MQQLQEVASVVANDEIQLNLEDLLRKDICEQNDGG